MPLPAFIFLAFSAILGAMSLWLLTTLPHIVFIYLIVVGVVIAVLFALNQQTQSGLRIISPRFYGMVLRTYQLFALCIFFLFGFLWCVHAAEKIMAQRIPKAYEGVPLIVTGKIVSLPEMETKNVHFDFLIQDARDWSMQQKAKNITWPMPEKIRLSWYFVQTKTPPILTIGDTWQFAVTLKSARSTFNPASFDYEAWLFAHRITAIGSVQNDANNIKMVTAGFTNGLDIIRTKILAAIEVALVGNPNLGVVEALALGMRNHLTSEQWRVMEATGTNHLLAIAGLHIGFVFAFIYVLIKFIWRKIYLLMRYMPAHEAALCVAWLVAILYSILSGLALPAARAIAMLSVALFASLLRRHIPPWHAVALGLFAVLINDPLTVFSESFYLSFASVCIIIFSISGYNQTGHWRALLRLQWVIALGLAPISLYFFHQISLMNFIANLIAIPWIAWLVLPLVLFGIVCLLFSHSMAALLWQLSAKSLVGYWSVLSFMSGLQRVQWHRFPNLACLLLATLGVFCLLLPKGFPCRILGVFGFLPLIFIAPQPIPLGAFKLSQLDVGQGLSTLVQTAHHTLVFDTGPRLDDRYDMGQSVVVPALFAYQCDHLDMLMISHADNDHSGGALAVLRSLPVMRVSTSVPELYSHLPSNACCGFLKEQSQTGIRPNVTQRWIFFLHGIYLTFEERWVHIMSWLGARWPPPQVISCIAGQSWQWDDVVFTVLSPTAANLAHSKNNGSCVLQLHNIYHSVLLTGDIEKPAEHALLKNYQSNLTALHAEIIVAPHHGSKTSSSAAFLSAVQPTWVFYATGYRNRFHFPSDVIVQRYRSLNVTSMDTAKDGQIIAFAPNQACCFKFLKTRAENRHFWTFL